ncbi:uncharacterized protein LOC143325061 [Chaetodon auriga]|uniref:uncharacterized protein LOC143325061 n=1 Tax=Chaetodon auriga TaxID=39042 RepID=UPI004032CCDA
MSVNLRMSFLDQMKLPGLIGFSLILMLASISKGQNWDINVIRHIEATLGSDVTIPCNFTYPPKYYTNNIQVYWKKPQTSTFDTKDNDRNAFVFHTNDSFVLNEYRGKTQLIGNTAEGNCSLTIKKIQDNEPNIYVRIVAQGERYSFKKKFVSISVPGVQKVSVTPDIANPALPTFETTTTAIPFTVGMTETTSIPYAAIFVPLAALLIIVFVAGIVFCIKHRRSKSFTREESGYYANFRKASSDQANREASSKKQDKKVPEPKAIDEPVYINVEVPQDQMDQSMDHTDNIYANVGYSK